MRSVATMHLAVATALLVVLAQRSFVDTAPVASQQSDTSETSSDYQDENVKDDDVKDDDVKELENLKHTLGKTLQMMKTQSAVYTNVNGQEEAHSETKEQLNSNGKLLALLGQNVDSKGGPEGTPLTKVRTKVDIPSKGIHKDVVEQLDPEQVQTENGNRRTSTPDSNALEKYGSYSGIQYSPLDMAEYVFWTGDEKGVTLAIEEFLREGMMSREEAISFLQEIKYNLDYLHSHYTQLGLNARERSKAKEKVQNGLFFNDGKTPSSDKPDLTSDFDITRLRDNVVNKKNVAHVAPPTYDKATSSNHRQEEQHKKVPNPDDQYDQLLEKLRVADFLYTEYSLEEVIYQLAKVMFTQSLTRGSSEAQQALQKFTNFLETEADQGRISRALEKKVLDVLIASLTDTLNEHPELEQGGNPIRAHKDGQDLLRQILQLSPEEKASVRVALSSHKDRSDNDPVQIQLKEDGSGGVVVPKNLDHLSLGLGKYKNL